MRRVVIVSDLHLSLGPHYRTEDFFAGEEFSAMLQSPLLNAGSDDQLDLVLLGDTFDLWQTALDDDEYEMQDSACISLDYSERDEKARLQRIQEAHPKFFQSLRGFMQNTGHRLTFVVGNHDHSLISNRVARESLIDTLGGIVVVAPNFDASELRLYAEHGNQWDADNTYDDFGAFGSHGECAGYYFVRLFWNRLETCEPRLAAVRPDWHAVWHYLLPILRSNPRVLSQAIRFWVQYQWDRRIPRRISVFAQGKEKEENALRGLSDTDGPDLLLSSIPDGENVFSRDPEMENAFRKAYHSEPQVREVVDELRPKQAPPVPLPGDSATPTTVADKTHSEQLKGQAGAAALFKQTPTGRDSPLDPCKYHFVVFGHTHAPGQLQLDNGAWYLNTGTWSGRNPSRMPLVVVEVTNAGPRAAFAHIERGRVETGKFLDWDG